MVNTREGVFNNWYIYIIYTYILTNTLLIRPPCPNLTGLPFNRNDNPRELRYGFATVLLLLLFFFVVGVFILAGMLLSVIWRCLITV